MAAPATTSAPAAAGQVTSTPTALVPEPKEKSSVSKLAEKFSNITIQTPALNPKLPVLKAAAGDTTSVKIASQPAVNGITASAQVTSKPKLAGAVPLFSVPQSGAKLQIELHRDIMQELGLRFSMGSFDGIAANVRSLTDRVEKLIDRKNAPLSRGEIVTVLNEARACMQAVENIFKALGANDDYRTPMVRQKVERLKTDLTKLIDTLTTRTIALTETDQFMAGLNNISEYEADKADEVGDAIETFNTKASQTLGVVHFEQDQLAANAAVDLLTNSNKVTPENVLHVVNSAQIVLDRTADGLKSFQEAASVVVGYKNSLLDKMRKAQETLKAKVGQVISTPDVRACMEGAPAEVKEKHEKGVALYQKAAEEATEAAIVLEKPIAAGLLTEEQKKFVQIVNGALNEKGKLPENLKEKLNQLAARMMPLIKAIEVAKSKNSPFAPGDVCSLAQSMIDFVLFYQHFVDVHHEAISNNFAAYCEVRTRCELGLDALIEYLRDGSFAYFTNLLDDALVFLGELEEVLFTELKKAQAKYDALMVKVWAL